MDKDKIEEIAMQYSLDFQSEFYDFIKKLEEEGGADDHSADIGLDQLARNVGTVIYEITKTFPEQDAIAMNILNFVYNEALRTIAGLRGDVPFKVTVHKEGGQTND